MHSFGSSYRSSKAMEPAEIKTEKNAFNADEALAAVTIQGKLLDNPERLEHPQAVWDIAWSPNGKLLATACCDGVVRLWDTRNNKIVHEMRGHESQVLCVTFSPDGKYVASGSGDRYLSSGEDSVLLNYYPHFVHSTDHENFRRGEDTSIRLWNVSTGKEVRRIRGHKDNVNSVAFSADGKRLISGSGGQSRNRPHRDNSSRVWDVATGKELFTLSHALTAAVAASPDGEHFATTGIRVGDANAWLWNSQGTEIQAFPVQEIFSQSDRYDDDAYPDAVFSPSGDYLGLACQSGAQIWNVRNGSLLHDLQSGTQSIAFSPDNKLFAMATFAWNERTGYIIVCRTLTGEPLYALTGHEYHDLRRVRFSPMGNQIASCCFKGTVYLHDVEPDDGSAVPKVAVRKSRNEPLSETKSGGWAPKGTILPGELPREKQALKLKTKPISDIAFAPDGKTMALGLKDSTIRLRNVESGKETHLLRGHEREVGVVLYSPNGKYLISGGNDGAIRFWDAETGKPIRIIKDLPFQVRSISCSPDGTQFAASGKSQSSSFGPTDVNEHFEWSSGNQWAVWSTETLEMIPYDKKIYMDDAWLNYSPDGRWLVVAGESSNFLFDPHLEKKIADFPEETTFRFSEKYFIQAENEKRHETFYSAFSPDGKKIALATPPGILDVKTGAFSKLVGHQKNANEKEVSKLAFSPDGKYLVTGGVDGTTRIWNVETASEMCCLEKREKPVASVACSHDGKYIATGGNDGILKLWPFPSNEELRTEM